MTLKAQKTYQNGCTQTAYVNDRNIEAHTAQIDAEDATAGLIGTWEVIVYKLDGRLV
jgi:predicted amino acid dehydrogenase